MTPVGAPMLKRQLIPWILIVLLALLFLTPLFWAISASLHTNATIFKTPFSWIPIPAHWGNYVTSWKSASFSHDVVNSFFIAIAIAVVCTVFSHMAGYGLAKFVFRGRNLIFGAIIGTLLMPFSAIMIPVFVIVRELGWVNSYEGIIVPGIMTAQAVFFMRQYMFGVPDELIASARVDGASEWLTYWRIVFPLTWPVVITVAVLTFVGSWNNLLWPLVVVNSQHLYTIPLGLAQFNNVYFTNYVFMTAMALVSIIPVIVLFLLTARRLLNSIMISSGVKG